MPLFGLPPEKIRIIQMETGGGFGGKEEYPSMIAGHAALLAWKSGKPVKLIYDRAEDMTATTKRHPSRTRHRTGVTRDGKLVAMEIEFDIDGGAYATLSAVVLSRGTIHAAGPYSCPNVRIRSRAFATTYPPHGAFRGFGAPQSIFALERQMNKVAAALGLPPEEFRRRNFLHQGQTTATGQIIHEKVDLDDLLFRALELSHYHHHKETFDLANPASRLKRGIGFATFMHGAGFTGSGEVALASIVTVEATREGKVRILTASTEIGQGTNTIFSQIAADALHIDYSLIELAQPDTSTVPNSGPTVASRTVMVVGKLVEAACLGLKQTLIASGLLSEPYTSEGFAGAARDYVDQIGPLRASGEYKPPPNVFWNDETYQGDAYGAYAWAVYVAMVTVDPVTYEVRIDDFVAMQEVGKVIHPVLAMGQIEGGVAQAIGFALYERVAWSQRPHGERPDDELHHAHLRRPAAHPRVLRRKSVRLRPQRRERNRRAAHGRRRARDSERHRTCHRCGFQPNPLGPRIGHGGPACALTSTASTTPSMPHPCPACSTSCAKICASPASKKAAAKANAAPVPSSSMANSPTLASSPSSKSKAPNITTIEGVAHGGRSERSPAGLLRTRRRPMRHLHARHDPGRDGLLEEHPDPTLEQIKEGLCRESVPLHRLYADLRSGHSRGAQMRSHVPSL